MSTTVDPLFVLSDRQLNKKLIGELQSIVPFMKLDATLKKDAFLHAIQHHMKVHPDVAGDPHSSEGGDPIPPNVVATPESEIKVEMVNNNQWMKKRSGRVYRPLSVTTLNTTTSYTLRKLDEVTFDCDIFWDQLTGGAIAGQGTMENPRKHELAGAMGSRDDKMDGPKVFTGAGSDVPLDIANDRVDHDPMHKNASAAQRELLAHFVHGEVQEAVPGRILTLSSIPLTSLSARNCAPCVLLGHRRLSSLQDSLKHAPRRNFGPAPFAVPPIARHPNAIVVGVSAIRFTCVRRRRGLDIEL
ncbi:hypothetical protein C8J57DRAFT_1518357 [Mycena rebaudengoi]|nr:hypothetical protein C8J57DRAFT_1518357 [Mycena rebaudengoi]